MKKIEINGQISLEEYLAQRSNYCNACVCRKYLYWWSNRCPFGECWDDYRSKEEPYDEAHSHELPRQQWSNWDKPGEQAHWCRGGIFYPVFFCQHFVKYLGQQVKECLKGNILVFQDGYIICSLIECYGCEKCYEEFLRSRNE